MTEKKPYKKAYLEITNVCNLHCEFCPKTGRKPQFMTVACAETAMREIARQTDYVYFHLMGEPLLHPDLETLMNLAEQNGLRVNLTTNGTLLGEKYEFLYRCKPLRKVSVSLHSFEANAGGLALTEYLNSVAEFCERVSDTIVELRLWNLDGEIPGKNGLNGTITDFFLKRWNLSSEKIAANGGKLREGIYLGFGERFFWGDLRSEDTREHAFCYGLRDQFGVLCDGTVVPCCLDSDGNIPLGNLFEQPLESILNGERARRIYRGFTERRAVEELCKRCGYCRRF